LANAGFRGCTLGQPVRQASALAYEGSVCHPIEKRKQERKERKKERKKSAKNC